MAMIHIIGAGVSGLAAATKLAEAHMPVRLYEATSHAGGRARSSNHPDLGTIDHGLHIVEADSPELDAYLTRIGAQDTLTRVKHPLKFSAAPIMDYLELLGLFTRRPRHADATFSADSVLRPEWASRVSRLLFHTPLDSLSGAAARRVGARYLKRGKLPGARMAARSLTESFIAPALTHLEYRGGSVYFNQQLRSVECKDGRVTQLTFTKQKVALDETDIVILALPGASVAQFLPEVKIEGRTHSSITLHYDIEHREGARSHTPDAAPVDIIRYAQGRISASVRVADHLWHSDPDFLAARIWNYLVKLHPYLDKKMPPHAVWREKLAGHTLSVDRAVEIPTLHERLLIAGDWCEVDAPASIEGAIASGHRAADKALVLIGKHPLRTQ